MPLVNPLELRRRLLVAESDINRARSAQEWQTMVDGVRSLAHPAKSIGSLISAASMLMTGLSAFRHQATPVTIRTSKFQTVLKSVELLGSLWLAFRGGHNEGKK
jgi:hypothetical protein